VIDTHCHIDLYKNPLEIARECEELGITTIGMTNLPSHFNMGYEHLKGFKKVRLALGMHPLYAANHEKEFPLFQDNLSRTSYIGEVGLDFSKEGLETKEIQKKTFEKILREVGGLKKLLSVHSRRAEKEVLFCLKQYEIKLSIFHWYSGPISFINEIIDAGYYFSINTAMIRSASGKSIIGQIPVSNILTETDGPFIEYNGRIVKPQDVGSIEVHLAKHFQMTQEEISLIIQNNFRNIISFLK
jgi:TatD DNase family protein